MRKSAKKPVQIKKNRIKVSFKSKDIKKNSPKHNSKLLLSNKSSILSSARSCNESTDESDTETEEIPYVLNILIFFLTNILKLLVNFVFFLDYIKIQNH